ncbi:MAG: hypothetical protein DRJ42_14110 [Deltaproteobacteria bacterium]|nr:MAG: hypothetical protein DRJ42_14110 [Deltaproteobacteria bacterium]
MASGEQLAGTYELDELLATRGDVALYRARGLNRDVLIRLLAPTDANRRHFMRDARLFSYTAAPAEPELADTGVTQLHMYQVFVWRGDYDWRVMLNERLPGCDDD